MASWDFQPDLFLKLVVVCSCLIIQMPFGSLSHQGVCAIASAEQAGSHNRLLRQTSRRQQTELANHADVVPSGGVIDDLPITQFEPSYFAEEARGLNLRMANQLGVIQRTLSK